MNRLIGDSVSSLSARDPGFCGTSSDACAWNPGWQPQCVSLNLAWPALFASQSSRKRHSSSAGNPLWAQRHVVDLRSERRRWAGRYSRPGIWEKWGKISRADRVDLSLPRQLGWFPWAFGAARCASLHIFLLRIPWLQACCEMTLFTNQSPYVAGNEPGERHTGSQLSTIAYRNRGSQTY